MFPESYEQLDEADILERLKTLGIPVAEEYFPESKNPPYAVLTTPAASYEGADGANLYRKQTFAIELYTSAKKDPVRKKFFDLFSDRPFKVEEESAGMKNYYVTVISFTQILYDIEPEE